MRKLKRSERSLMVKNAVLLLFFGKICKNYTFLKKRLFFLDNFIIACYNKKKIDRGAMLISSRGVNGM